MGVDRIGTVPPLDSYAGKECANANAGSGSAGSAKASLPDGHLSRFSRLPVKLGQFMQEERSPCQRPPQAIHAIQAEMKIAGPWASYQFENRLDRHAISQHQKLEQLMPILLYPGRPQARQPMIRDRGLPGKELLHRQCVTLACLLKAEKAAAYSGYHLGLAADDPTPRIGGWEVGNGQRAAIRADNILHSWSYQIGHCTLYTTLKDPIKSDPTVTA